MTGQDGAAIPGVTVTAASPSLQGVRSVVTTSVGDYIIPFLPPGEYTLTFELQGFQTAEQKTLVTAAGTVTLDAKLQVAGVAEAVTVTGSVADAFSAGVSAATTFKQELIDDLPLNRGIEATTALDARACCAPDRATPGVPEISISGGISSENLVLVNGVVAQDNVRRSALPVYIEDSLQETTITTSGVSAEFGRFSGGVVNAITKSGGNRFSGTFRTNLANDNWRALTPFPGDTTSDTIVPVYEYTARRAGAARPPLVLHRRPLPERDGDRSAVPPGADALRAHDAAAPVRRQGHVQPVQGAQPAGRVPEQLLARRERELPRQRARSRQPHRSRGSREHLVVQLQRRAAAQTCSSRRSTRSTTRRSSAPARSSPTSSTARWSPIA